jgi:transcriptional regulator with GAF, ATPase, and Fis domain
MEVKEQKKEYLTLSQISDIVFRINSEQDLESLLTIIMDTARNLLKTQGASLLLYDEETGDLVFDIARGDRSNILASKRVPKGQGIAGECARTKKTHHCKRCTKRSAITTRYRSNQWICNKKAYCCSYACKR